MKIAIIIEQFPPKCLHGAEIATYNLAKQLAKRGHEIHVITSHDEGLPNFGKEGGFFIHRIAFAKIPIIGVFSFWLKIFLKIRIIKPNIVHAQGLGMGPPVWVIRKILKIPYIIWGMGSDVYLPDWFGRITTKPILQKAHAILALTENMRIKLKTFYDTEIYVIPLGIDLEEYIGVSIYPERKTGNNKILFVGRLNPVKGIQYLIMAMKKIHEEIPDARLILVGDGEEREKLEALSFELGIKKFIQFVGIIPHEKVQTYMQRADIFVLPSLSEGLPNVILEAMACGLPIVASRVGGIPDIIMNDINGYLVEVKDTESMAKRIILLLQDNILWKKISENNTNTVKKYTWDNIIVDLEKIYQSPIK